LTYVETRGSFLYQFYLCLFEIGIQLVRESRPMIAQNVFYSVPRWAALLCL